MLLKKFLLNNQCRMQQLKLNRVILFGLIHLMLGVGLVGCYSYPLLEDVRQSSDYTYKIGTGDNLTIFVWGNPELSTSAVVRPDGKISFPLVEELLAMGKTPFELARDIENVLMTYVKSPQVVVMANGFKGVRDQQIRVIGRIGGGTGTAGGATASNSGGIGRYQGRTIPYERGMTLLDIVIQIGLNQYADGNRSTVIRSVNGEVKTYGVRIDDLIDNADLTANILMMPGDVLIVPDSMF
jgi:polysaccharide export outer membrane protein